MITVYYQMLPTSSYVDTLIYPYPPSINRSCFAYVHSFKKHTLGQMIDVLTSLVSYVFLWL